MGYALVSVDRRWQSYIPYVKKSPVSALNMSVQKVDYGRVKTMVLFLPFVAKRKPN